MASQANLETALVSNQVGTRDRTYPVSGILKCPEMYILTKFIKLSQRKGCDGGNKSRENELPVLIQKRKKKQSINSSLGWSFHCRKKYMVRVFCRQNLQLIFTVIEAKIIFLKSCNFLIWSRLHSKLSLDNYTYT